LGADYWFWLRVTPAPAVSTVGRPDHLPRDPRPPRFYFNELSASQQKGEVVQSGPSQELLASQELANYLGV